MISSDLCFNMAYPKLFMLIQTLAPACTVNPGYSGQILVTSPPSAGSPQEDEEGITAHGWVSWASK